jgi:hypothetical protein
MTYQVKNRFQNLPFKSNLQRYTEVGAVQLLNPAVTHSLKGACFQPFAFGSIFYQVKNWFQFQAFAFEFQLAPLRRGVPDVRA